MPSSRLSILLNVFSSEYWDPRYSVYLSGSRSTLPTLEIKRDTDIFPSWPYFSLIRYYYCHGFWSWISTFLTLLSKLTNGFLNDKSNEHCVTDCHTAPLGYHPSYLGKCTHSTASIFQLLHVLPPVYSFLTFVFNPLLSCSSEFLMFPQVFHQVGSLSVVKVFSFENEWDAITCLISVFPGNPLIKFLSINPRAGA